MGTFVHQNGKKYHEQCHSQDVACAGCAQRLFGESVQACSKQWHPKCFKCTICYTPLGASFVERNSLPYCQKCSSKPPDVAIRVPTSVKASQQDQQQIEERNNSSKQLAANINQGKLFCADCGGVIQINDAVSLGDSVFHTTCFCCAKCGKALADCGFKDVGGQPHCPDCAGASGGGFCAGCGQKLVGKYVSALGQKWHQQCFVCSGCSQSFTSGYAEREGRPFCVSCIQKNAKPTVTSTAPVGERKGFTIDPRSGKKKYT